MTFEVQQNKDSIKKRVCIIIVNYNHQKYLPTCLGTLSSSISASDTVIIIDNNSENKESLNKIVKQYSNFHWIFNKENRGYTGANHQGSHWALKNGYQYLLILNPDTELFPNTIPILVSASKKCNDQWILGPLLIQSGTSENPIVDSAGLDIDKYYRAIDKYRGKKLSQIDNTKDIMVVNGLCGAAMFIPTTLFPLRSESGTTIFCETYFAYFEDVEFSIYWRKKGGQFGVVTKAWINHHRGDQSQLKKITYKKWKTNPFIIEKMFINRYLTIIRHETLKSCLKDYPAFLFYEIVRGAYIILCKPYLFIYTIKGWKMLIDSLIKKK